MKINGQWFVDLDDFVDVQRLNALHDSMALGIAKAMQYSEPVVIGSSDAQFDRRLTEVDLWIRQHPELLKLGLTPTQLYDYVKFSQPTISLGRKILLRTYNNYHGGFAMKHLARLNHDTEAYRHFPDFRAFIEESKIFREIGRVIIFLTEAEVAPPIHCDYADGKSRKDQFVWFNINRAKKFFVLDENLEKQYLSGHANVFDSASWHGGDPSPHATYTIRVDGSFSSEFLEVTGLKEHFRTRDIC
jgi:hypothetical protein